MVPLNGLVVNLFKLFGLNIGMENSYILYISTSGMV